jgi:hypothetical protein
VLSVNPLHYGVAVVSPKASGPEQTSGTWWTTLPGVLTGFAALLGAIGGLLATLHQVGIFPRPRDPVSVPVPINPSPDRPNLPPPPVPTPERTETAQVDGVTITILEARKSAERDASFLDVRYKVATGQDYVDHYPASFIRLASGGQAMAPIWTSVAPSRLGPNSRTEFAIRFPAPADLGKNIVLLVGEKHPVELPMQVAE